MPTAQTSQVKASRSPQGLYLLFSPGARPQRSRVLAAIETHDFVSVSHDPASSAADPEQSAEGREGYAGQWLELMISGLTFDLLGLAPAPSVKPPEVAHRMALDVDCNPDEKEAMALVPGPHLADAANSLPIVRAMLDIGCKLARALEDVEAICWSPSRSAMSTGLLCRSVDAWLGGGPFPALGITAFSQGEDGCLVSEGLAFFVGQELRFHPSLAEDRLAATRLGLRLVDEIVGTGRVEGQREFVTEDGQRLLLAPDHGTGIVEVTRM